MKSGQGLIRIFPHGLHLIHPRRARSMATPFRQEFQRRPFSLAKRFHPAVGQIAHPSLKSELERLVLQRVTETDALHPSADDYAQLISP